MKKERVDGLKVHAVGASPAGDEVILYCGGRDAVHITLTAACCSSSYFDGDSLTDLRGLVGQTLRSIEGVETDAPVLGCTQEEQRVHCLKITTDVQSVSVLWRNDSNGYYDGECYVSVTGLV